MVTRELAHGRSRPEPVAHVCKTERLVPQEAAMLLSGSHDAFNRLVVPSATLALAALSVAALVAPDTVGDVADAFFGMFANELLLLVFVATVAGVGRELATGVAGDAGNLVGAIQPEIPVMGESGRRPCLGRMTLGAAGGDRLVELVLGLGMATGALARDGGLEQGMIEARQLPGRQWHLGMVGMAGRAVRFSQLGMKQRRPEGPAYPLPGRRRQPDLRRLVTGDAPIR